MMSRKVKQQVNSAVNELDMNLANNYKDLAHKALKELDELVTKLNEDTIQNHTAHATFVSKYSSGCSTTVQTKERVFLRETTCSSLSMCQCY